MLLDATPIQADAPQHSARQPPCFHSPEQLDQLAELQSVLGYGSTSAQALNCIELELTGLRGGQRFGRVEGLAARDLLGEFRGPITVGELVTLRLRSPHFRGTVDSFGFVHWQQSVAGRWLAGVFLREQLPDNLLKHVWADMRRELRFPTRLSLRAVFGAQRVTQPAVVCDYSRSGARLQTRHKPVVGQRVDLCGEESLASGTVRYVRPGPQPALTEFGCEFANNSGVRLARMAVHRNDDGPPAWRRAEEWTTRHD